MQPTHEAQVRDQMARAGIECQKALIADGKIRRFVIPPSRKANGWYWLVERDGRLYGAFGDWKTQVRSTVGTYSPTMRGIVRALADHDAVAAERAARIAAEVWADASVTGESAYLTRKRVVPLGVRFRGGRVLVPMERDGRIVGIQTIDWDGKKLFTAKCAKRGASFFIRGNEQIVLCEGYATGASIHMATGFTVCVAFDAGNMVEVARLARDGGWAKFVVVVGGDNDHQTVCQRHRKMGHKIPLDHWSEREDWCLCNPGWLFAKRAAAILGSKVALPIGIKGTDFNDMHQELGPIEVAGAIYDAL